MSSHYMIPKTNREQPLRWALMLTATFFLVELIGGWLTGSLALISDAAHMFTDVVALVIAWAATRIARRPADVKRTFGYYRFEILAASINASLLFMVAGYVIYEAYRRLFFPAEIQSIGMFVIAVFGLAVNGACLWILSSHKKTNLNFKGAYLEVWSDALGSIGVILAAIIIRFTQWSWVDSVLAVAIGLWVLPRTWILLKESINILLEGVPENIDLSQLKKKMLEVKGILDIHDLHVWALTSDKVNLTAHVVVNPHENCEQVLSALRELLASQFSIFHTTLQHEFKKCTEQAGKVEGHSYGC